MSRDIVRQLKQLKHDAVNPREEWVESNRALLLAQIKNTLPAAKTSTLEQKLEKMWAALSIFLPRPLVYTVVRPVFAVFMVSIVALSAYSGTVKASYETVPGDWLYPAKRTAERAQGAVISLLGDKEIETKYHVSLAQRRVTEVKKIIASEGPGKASTKASEAVAELKNELASINTKLDQNQTVRADVVKEVRQNTEAIKETLQDVKNTLLLSASSSDQDLTKQVAETKDLAKDLTVKAVEVMVTKHLEGDTSVSKDEVKQAIDSSISHVADEMATSKQAVDGAKTIVETVKTQVNDLSKEMKKQEVDPAVNVTTDHLKQQLKDAASQTSEAVIKSDQVTAGLDKKLDEVREAVNSDDLTKAVDKLKEVNEVTKEAEKISDNTIQATQTVLPMVQVIKEVVTPSTNTTAIANSLLTNTNSLSISSTTILGAVTTTAEKTSSTNN